MIIFSVLKIQIMHTTSATYGTEQDRVIFGEKPDHLGNVRAVVSDVRKPVATTGSIDDWTWQADVTDYFSYFPYGMQEPGRQKQLNTVDDGGYRFGFNSMEKDDEFTGVTGSHLNFGERIYDSRIGKFLSIDKFIKDFPSYSAYLFAGNSPIKYIDFNGNFQFKIDEYADLDEEQKLKLEKFKTVVNKIQDFVNEHPEIYGYISNVTGLDIEQVKKDFTPGEGPTIEVGWHAETYQTEKSVEAEILQFEYNSAAFLDDLSGEELKVGALTAMSLIVHEYAHYGDRKTNDGWLTGEDDDPSAKQTSAPGKQKIFPTSPSKERVTDVEQLIWLGFINGRYHYDHSPGTLLERDIKNSEIYESDDADILLIPDEEETE
jgi:RHS repeat-associated protein